MIKALAAGIALWLAASAAAQSAPEWLRDLPSVQDVQQRIQGADAAQTLGRQCAALTRLERGNDVPAAFKFNPTPAMIAVAESYRAGLSDLRRRYDAIKPLADADHQRQWDRMCGNRQSGVHPLTGEVDPSFPALDQPVSEADFVALLGPAARAAYEAERAARADRSAAMDRQRETSLAAAERRDIEAMQQYAVRFLIVGGVPLFAIALLVAMVRALSRTRWQPGPGAREVQLRSAIFSVHDSGGPVLACDKRVQTIETYVRIPSDNGPDHVRKETRDVVHWDIRYRGSDGKPHDLRIKEWDISFRPGDVLQVYSLRRNGKTSTPALIVNRTTDESWSNASVVHAELVPLSGLIALPLVVAAGLFTLGIGWLIGFWWMRAARIKAAGKTAEVVQWLESLPPPSSVTMTA